MLELFISTLKAHMLTTSDLLPTANNGMAEALRLSARLFTATSLMSLKQRDISTGLRAQDAQQN
jgi:hypothetical protein